MITAWMRFCACDIWGYQVVRHNLEKISCLVRTIIWRMADRVVLAAEPRSTGFSMGREALLETSGLIPRPAGHEGLGVGKRALQIGREVPAPTKPGSHGLYRRKYRRSPD